MKIKKVSMLYGLVFIVVSQVVCSYAQGICLTALSVS